RDESLEIPQHVRREADRGRVPGAAMHNSVAGRDDRRPRPVLLNPFQDGRERIVVRRRRAQDLVGQAFAAGIAGDEARPRAETVDQTAGALHRVRGVGDVEHRELDRRRARVDDEQDLAQYLGPRRPNASATAHEAILVAGLSARLVRTIGTRAPRTMPAARASARYSSCLASKLPDSRSGTTRMSARPATADSMPLTFAASSEIALSKASGPSRMPPVICPRSAILQSAAASIVERISGVGVSTAERIAAFGSAMPRTCARAIAFCTMSGWAGEPGPRLAAGAVV